MAEGALSRVRGTFAVVRELPGQRRAPYLPAELALEQRDRRMRAAVGFAAAHVPFYREFFTREGIDPRALRSANDLANLPLIEKRTVQRDPERFRPDTAWRDDVVAADGVEFEPLATTIAADVERVLRGCSVEAERHDELRAEGRKFRPVVPLR